MDCVKLSENECFAVKQALGIEELANVHVCEKNENFTLVRTVWKEEKDVTEFLKYMNDEKHITWRVAQTNPSDMAAGNKNIYYKVFRCQSSNSQIKSSTKHVHPKHTDCYAQMRITIKRTGHRCRSKDEHLPEYPTIIRFKNKHNHNVYCADNLPLGS